ncbi:hypothetical protein EFL99_05615 [Lactococcus lactis]|uniref:hypothetical protein n=1 Tax=Lactococcus lactis TaxID=1358 RepID=UPI002026077D|nr:hypothetical protein [Lactococcus lactis]MCL9638867.1 hypothetical protein [Lactococcus lactis]MCT1182751.1 hypothetical protein [Lactococcus lactis]
MSNKQFQKGDSNTNQNGDNNTNSTTIYNFPSGLQTLNPSKLFALLKIVQESKIESNTEFSLELPEELYSKLNFNKAPKYANIFIDSLEDYNNLDDIIKNDFTNSQRIIQKIRRLFFNHCNFDTNSNPIPDNGDEILDGVFGDLKNEISNDSEFIKSQISIEELEQFIIALLQYGVAECKILVNPNQK